MPIYKEDITLKVDAQGLNSFLDATKITGPGQSVAVFAELIKMTQKCSKDTQLPFISFIFKDIKGNIIQGTKFEAKIPEDLIDNLSKLKRLFVKMYAETNLYGGTLKLIVNSLDIIEDKSVILELTKLFTVTCDNIDEKYENLSKIDFGDYNCIIKDILICRGGFVGLKTATLEECGASKLGSVLELIVEVFSLIDVLAIDKHLSKAVFLYTITLYSGTKPITMLNPQASVAKTLAIMLQHMKEIKSLLPGDKLTILTKYENECERVILNLLLGDVGTQSVTSGTISSILNIIKEFSLLKENSMGAAKSSLFRVNGKEYLNQ